MIKYNCEHCSEIVDIMDDSCTHCGAIFDVQLDPDADKERADLINKYRKEVKENALRIEALNKEVDNLEKKKKANLGQGSNRSILEKRKKSISKLIKKLERRNKTLVKFIKRLEK